MAAAPLLERYLHALIDDFYDEIERHPNARKVITGGPAQIERLKGTLVQWIRDLLAGQYDADYVARRWRVGWRHVEIGLDQVYTNVALSRLRTGLVRSLHESWQGDPLILKETVRALNKLLDLDLAIIEDAYQAEYMARLQANERLATLGQVAGGVAHELRNPLNVVKTSVYYLRNARNLSPQKQAEHLQRIEHNVEVANGVVTSLSNFAKAPVPGLRPFAVESFIRDTLEINPLGNGIEVKIDCPPGLPDALGDGDQLRIALGNLVRNAKDAMPDGGRMMIAGRAVDGFVEVSVTDTGVGIPQDVLPRVTEPLYSTKARGLGLGLAISRSIVEKNQGMLRVASEPGQGQRLHDPVGRGRRRWRIAVNAQRRARILVVDDDPDIRGNLSDILTDLGYRRRLCPGRTSRPRAGRPAPVRRRAAGSENARHGRADALSRDQEAARRDGVASGHGLRQPATAEEALAAGCLESRAQAGRSPQAASPGGRGSRAAAGAGRRRRPRTSAPTSGTCSRSRLPGQPGTRLRRSGRAAQEHEVQGRPDRHADPRRGRIRRVPDRSARPIRRPARS